MRRSLILFVILSGFLSARAETLLQVHEWGTFTSLQDENGDAIGGINTDDEPVPAFVHRLVGGFFLSPTEAPPTFFQGAPKCHPDVTMRLETPVLYFYPPPGAKKAPLTLEVSFRGGWLTEFYPQAEAWAPGFDAAQPEDVFTGEKTEKRRFAEGFGHLNSATVGQLFWRDIVFNEAGRGPETTEKVWLAPRAVPAAAQLQAAGGESERFLFYRGVGHATADLRVVSHPRDATLQIEDAAPAPDLPATDRAISAAWLVEVRPDGACAFRSLGVLKMGTTLPAGFAAGDFTAERLVVLQKEMGESLQKAGLFPDEATALLRTWEISYFKSAGLRLFYLCSPSEIQRLLPLKISVPCELKRVLIGRIELVTSSQRASLAKIAAAPKTDLSEMRGETGNPGEEGLFQDVMNGRQPLRMLVQPIPAVYEEYLSLGRFRNALLLDEARRNPTPGLRDFIERNGFSAYSPH